MDIPKTEELFDLSHTIAADLFCENDAPYSVIDKIKDYCLCLIQRLDENFVKISDGVYAASDAKISSTATIIGPAIIGHGAEIRPGAYIRGSVIVGDGAVVGNSTEVKNSIIFDGAALPHYNYVGDSIIGYKAHLGAGVVISNLRLDRKPVTIKSDGEKIDTGLRKMGALIGDGAEIGCGTVISPGSIIGRGCIVYPLSSFRGILPRDHYFYGDGREPQKNYDKEN